MRATRRGSLAIPVLVAILLSVAAPTAALAAPEDWDWNFNAILGQRKMPDDDWFPFEKYSEIGVEGSFGKVDEPLLFATDLFMSQDSKREGDKTIFSDGYQLQLGLRKIWTFAKRWNPYAGAGLTLAQSDADRVVGDEVENESDLTEGFWLGGGLFFRAGRNLNLGIAARATLMKDYRLFGADRNGSSTHLGFVIGWGAERATEK